MNIVLQFIHCRTKHSSADMRTLVVALLLLSVPGVVWAQSDEEAVRATIDQFFDGMRAGDSSMVAATLHRRAEFGRALDTEYRFSSPEGFLRAVGTPHDQVWNEEIWDVMIHVDGRLATAWMEFAFFLGDTLSHCGVNSMMMYKEGEDWKIVHLSDTNRACDDLPEHLRDS